MSLPVLRISSPRSVYSPFNRYLSEAQIARLYPDKRKQCFRRNELHVVWNKCNDQKLNTKKTHNTKKTLNAKNVGVLFERGNSIPPT